MENTIFLRRKRKLMITNSKSKLPQTYVATIMKNIESLGFTFSEKLIKAVSTLSEDKAVEFYKATVKDLKAMVGANVEHKPMYPNFPKQVMEMSECELYINAIIHYFTLGKVLPEYEKEERFPLVDNTKLKLIDLGTKKEFEEIFTNLAGTKTSISKTDKEDLKYFVTRYGNNIKKLLPKEIPHKENLSYVTALVMQKTNLSDKDIAKYYNTATDVLRLITALSDGDVSLSENTKYKSMNRKTRRFLLSLINSSNSIAEDMLRHESKWKRVGEVLHPFDYKDKYPKVYDAFYAIRNGVKISTFNSKVEQSLATGELKDTIALLKTRAGDMARRLDHLLRKANTKISTKKIVDSFKEVAVDVSTPVLLQVKNHFSNRTVKSEYRTIFPKGNAAKVKLLDNDLPTIEEKACKDIVRICKNTLSERFDKMSNLGKIYLDSGLKNYTVPFSQRSASKSLKSLSRGSRIKLDGDKNTIRFFIYWKNISRNSDNYSYGGGSVDIDLSAVMYDKDWNYLEHVSYTELRSEEYNAYHSGDITDAPRGASEFIDLDIPSMLKKKVRYIVPSVFSYSGQSFDQIDTCQAGWMLREKPNSGEIYEPKTVEDKLDVAGDGTIGVPVIIDLKEREIIWSDIALKPNRRVNTNSWFRGGNNVENNQ